MFSILLPPSTPPNPPTLSDTKAEHVFQQHPAAVRCRHPVLLSLPRQEIKQRDEDPEADNLASVLASSLRHQPQRQHQRQRGRGQTQFSRSPCWFLELFGDLLGDGNSGRSSGN